MLEILVFFLFGIVIPVVIPSALTNIDYHTNHEGRIPAGALFGDASFFLWASTLDGSICAPCIAALVQGRAPSGLGGVLTIAAVFFLVILSFLSIALYGKLRSDTSWEHTWKLAQLVLFVGGLSVAWALAGRFLCNTHIPTQ